MVWVAASKEAVTHHALDEQKKNNRQDNGKQEMPNSERRWLSFWSPIVHGDAAPATSLYQNCPLWRRLRWLKALFFTPLVADLRLPSQPDSIIRTRPALNPRLSKIHFYIYPAMFSICR